MPRLQRFKGWRAGIWRDCRSACPASGRYGVMTLPDEQGGMEISRPPSWPLQRPNSSRLRPHRHRQLHDRDGIELRRDILRIADVPVIFLSVYGQDETVDRAFDIVAGDYMVKPFSPTELTIRLRAALRRRLEPFAGCPRHPAKWRRA